MRKQSIPGRLSPPMRPGYEAISHAHIHMHKMCVDIRHRCTVYMYTPTHVFVLYCTVESIHTTHIVYIHVYSMYVNTQETCILYLNLY